MMSQWGGGGRGGRGRGRGGEVESGTPSSAVFLLMLPFNGWRASKSKVNEKVKVTTSSQQLQHHRVKAIYREIYKYIYICKYIGEIWQESHANSRNVRRQQRVAAVEKQPRGEGEESDSPEGRGRSHQTHQERQQWKDIRRYWRLFKEEWIIFRWFPWTSHQPPNIPATLTWAVLMCRIRQIHVYINKCMYLYTQVTRLGLWS